MSDTVQLNPEDELDQALKEALAGNKPAEAQIKEEIKPDVLTNEETPLESATEVIDETIAAPTPQPETPPTGDALQQQIEDLRRKLAQADNNLRASQERLAPTQKRLAEYEKAERIARQKPQVDPVKTSGSDPYAELAKQYGEEDAEVFRSVLKPFEESLKEKDQKIESLFNYIEANVLPIVHSVDHKRKVSEIESKHPDWRDIEKDKGYWDFIESLEDENGELVRLKLDLGNNEKHCAWAISQYKSTLKASAQQPAQQQTNPNQSTIDKRARLVSQAATPSVKAQAVVRETIPTDFDAALDYHLGIRHGT